MMDKKFYTLPSKRISTPQVIYPCGDVLHRPCPFCNLTTVQDYTILKRLGGGSFSNVFSASHPSQESPIVLKLLLKTTESLSLFGNEVSILGKINHPNIVKMLDHFETQDFYAIVLECVPGRELFDIISSDYHTLSREDQKQIFKQIASGNLFI
jgi:serine/threonine protein kinase